MPSNYTGNATAVQAPDAGAAFGRAPVLALPIDGDDLNVSSLYQPLKVLADYVAMINQANWLNWQSLRPSDDNVSVDAGIAWFGLGYKGGSVSERVMGVTARTKAYRSVDGITWSSVTLPFDFRGPLSTARPLAWSPLAGLFIMCGDFSSGDGILTSPDGTTWTARTDPGSAVVRTAIAESSTIIVVARHGGGFITSSDGITWTERAHPASDKLVEDVAWSPTLGLFCAVTITGSRLTSPDGITWTNRGNPNAIANLTSIVWSAHHGVFVAQDYATGQTERSGDGINWTAGGSTLATGFFGGRNMVADGPAIYSAGSVFARSLNGGISWEITNAPGIGVWYGVEKIDGRLALYGSSGSSKPFFAMSVKLSP